MRNILLDLEAILKTIPSVTKVSHRKPLNIEQETEWNSIYIVPDSHKYDIAKQSTKLDGYDDYMYVKLIVNCNNVTDDLEYTYLYEDILKAVLSDSLLWHNVVDRDVVASAFDEYENYPKKTFEVMFEFRYRYACN